MTGAQAAGAFTAAVVTVKETAAWTAADLTARSTREGDR